MKPGLYDHLLTKAIEAEIARLGDPRLVALAPVDAEESHSVLAQYLERLIASSLALHRGSDAAEKQQQLVERIVATLSETLNEYETNGVSIATPLQRLLAIHRTSDATANDRPDSRLSRSSLFTGTRLDASLGSQLRKEIATCDRVDILCSFIKWSGLRVLLDNLRELAERSGDYGPVIRVITTSYMGATDRKLSKYFVNYPTPKFALAMTPNERDCMQRPTYFIETLASAAPTLAPQTCRTLHSPKDSNGLRKSASTNFHTSGTKSPGHLKPIGKTMSSKLSTKRQLQDYARRFKGNATLQRIRPPRSTSTCVRFHSKKKFSTSSLLNARSKTNINPEMI